MGTRSASRSRGSKEGLISQRPARPFRGGWRFEAVAPASSSSSRIYPPRLLVETVCRDKIPRIKKFNTIYSSAVLPLLLPSSGITINTSLYRAIHSGSPSFPSLLFLLSQPRSFSLPIPRGPLSLIIHRLLTDVRAARTDANIFSPRVRTNLATPISLRVSDPQPKAFPKIRFNPFKFFLLFSLLRI